MGGIVELVTVNTGDCHKQHNTTGDWQHINLSVLAFSVMPPTITL